MDRRSISMFLDEEEKRQRERRRSSTPPIPEEPEDADSDYMSGGSPSPTEQQQHAAATIHRQHAPPSRSDTRTSTGFREPRVTWHHEGPAITGGGAQYPDQFSDSDGTTILVKGFDRYLGEDAVREQLTAAFAHCGAVSTVRLPTESESGELKGIGFIEFATTEAKNKAGEFDGTEAAGGYLKVDLNPTGGGGGRGGGPGGGRGGGGSFGGGSGGGRGFGGRDGGRVARGSDSMVQEFHDVLQWSPDTAVAVAAIKALTSVIRKSTARTMMGLEKELKDAAASLQSCNPTAISLKAGCELFLRYTTRTSAIENEDFATAKARIIENNKEETLVLTLCYRNMYVYVCQRGKQFAETSTRARQTIAELGAGFVHHDAVVLVHGFSRVVLALLHQVANNGVQFSVVVTEGRPDSTGLNMANALSKMKVPCTVVLDSAVAFALEALKVNLVLVGAEGVVENGGIINKLGSYHVAIAAKEHAIPFYVAAESYKFARLYPLNQLDLPVEKKHVDFGPLMAQGAKIENPSRDYTPPKYISLLFTDLGVLTPAAVSDELIQLYV